LPVEERDILFPRAEIVGRTRDVSESGLGLVAPSIYLGFDCIVDAGRMLHLSLDLPGGDTVEIRATSAHYLRVDEDGGEAVYIIGLRIIEIIDDSRARYLEYLGELNAAGQG
jgi:hypothetical protein